MITPELLEDYEVQGLKYDMLEAEIDKSVKEHHGEFPWERAILKQDLSMKARNNLAKRYLGAGWMYVYHRTTTMNDENPNVTTFVFSKTPLMAECVEGYTAVTAAKVPGNM